jgi:hypothetical protein
MAVGAMLLYGAMHFHVVRANDGFHFIAKTPAHLSEAYVDVRHFTVADWNEHPALATSLVRANKQNLMGGSVVGSIKEEVNQLLPPWPDE